jgi:hypothetical protein
MKTVAGFLMVVSFIAGFSSCQKEIDWSLPNTTTSDSTVLWKYVVLDTTLTTGLDTLEVYYFEYDSQKRLGRIREYSREDTSSSPAYPYSHISDFSYNGNETRPFKRLETFIQGADNQWDTTYFSYQNGLVSQDSSRIQISDVFGITWGIITHSFAVNGTTVTSTEKFFSYINPNPSCVSNSTVLQTYSNGNISSENSTTTGCVTGSGNDQLTYDNKANPFYSAVPVHYPITGFSMVEGNNNQKNNMTEEISAAFHTQRTYSYRSNGLPSVVIVNDILFPGSSYKGLYYYKN